MLSAVHDEHIASGSRHLAGFPVDPAAIIAFRAFENDPISITPALAIVLLHFLAVVEFDAGRHGAIKLSDQKMAHHSSGVVCFLFWVPVCCSLCAGAGDWGMFKKLGVGVDKQNHHFK